MLARARSELARQQPQQRGLARSIRAHDRQLVALLDLHGRVRDHVRALHVAERQVAQPDQRATGVGRSGEGEADAARRARNHLVHGLQPLDLLALALCLRGLRVLGAEALDELLELRDPGIELRVRGRGLLAAELLLLQIEREAHAVGSEPPVLQLAHLGRHPVQEDAIVGDHDESAAEVLQVVLEPLHRRQVQVVRGLVHEQHGRVGEQQGRERGAHAPAAGELGQRPVLVGGGEAQSRQHPARLGLERVLVEMLEVMLEIPGAFEQRLQPWIVLRHAGQLLVQRIQLHAQVEQRPVRLHGAIEHRPVVALGRLLRQVAHARAARPNAQAALGRVLAEDQPDERGLAGAVRTHQRAAVARSDDPVHTVEQDAFADAVAQRLQLDQEKFLPLRGRFHGGAASVRAMAPIVSIDPGTRFDE